jgi:hypothetical protein
VNKVYFVRHWDDCEGLYVGAQTRSKAKTIGYHEIGCDYVDVRTEVIKGKETERTGILSKTEIETLGIPTYWVGEEGNDE